MRIIVAQSKQFLKRENSETTRYSFTVILMAIIKMYQNDHFAIAVIAFKIFFEAKAYFWNLCLRESKSGRTKGA